MDTSNALLTALGDRLLGPFRDYAAWGLVIWSAVIGVIMTYVFGRTSNQRALRRAADGIRAQLFAIKLFKDDLLVTFQCQVALLKSVGLRLLHSIIPMLVLLVPLLVVLTQLAMRYEFQPLVDGEQIVVAMRINPDNWKETRDIQLPSGQGFVVETDGLRDEKASTIYWRVRAQGNEPARLQWTIGDHTVDKHLPIAPSHSTLSVANPKRSSGSFWDRVLYPAESSLAADGPIASIELQLTPRSTPILGWNIPWWGTFFIVSIVVALIAGKVMGVQY